MNINHKSSYKDFGNQFKIDSKIDGYWGSDSMLEDIVKPFKLNKIFNKEIMELGTGSGRILKNLITFKPKKIYGIEPSSAINVAKKNLKKYKIDFKKIKGEDLDFNNQLDFIFSLGVIHHIPNYDKVLKNIYNSLKPKGEFIVWVYGKEQNYLYLLIFNNLRRLTIHLPDSLLRILSIKLNIFTYVYGFFCNFLKLPLREYFLNVFNKCSFEKRTYIIFDQLNPSYAKYFTKLELYNSLKKAGFKTIDIYSRYNYSWTAICKK